MDHQGLWYEAQQGTEHHHRKLRWKARTLFITLGCSGGVLRWQKVGKRVSGAHAAIAAAASGKATGNEHGKCSLPLLSVMAVVDSLGVCPAGHSLTVTIGAAEGATRRNASVVKRKAGEQRVCACCAASPLPRPGDGCAVMLGCEQCGYEVCQSCSGKRANTAEVIARGRGSRHHVALACEDGRVLRVRWGSGENEGECQRALKGLSLLEQSNRMDVYGSEERSDQALTALLNINQG